LKHVVSLLEDFVVGEPKDAQPHPLEDGSAYLVALNLGSMNFSIDFEDEAGGNTIEVDDEPPYGMLSSEATTSYFPCTNLFPEPAFGECRLAPHAQRLRLQVLPEPGER
jgi:hypothetical protein